MKTRIDIAKHIASLEAPDNASKAIDVFNDVINDTMPRGSRYGLKKTMASGVMFFKGQRITIDEFMEVKRKIMKVIK